VENRSRRGHRLDVGTLNGYRETIQLLSRVRALSFTSERMARAYAALYRQLWSSSKRQAANEIDQSSCIEG
jgi:hypothetical protein